VKGKGKGGERRHDGMVERILKTHGKNSKGS
jgi:hypothetical protein